MVFMHQSINNYLKISMASIQIKDSCLTKDNFLKIQKENAKKKRKEDAKH